MTAKPRAIILDLDGTLNTSNEYLRIFEDEYWVLIAEKLRVTLEEARKTVSLVRKEHLSLTKCIDALGFDIRSFYDALSARIDVNRYVKKDEKLPAIISELRALGLRVAILSNTGTTLVLRVLDALGCPSSLFDGVFTSYDTKPKPSHDAFLFAAGSLGVASGEAIYVGDRIDVEIRPAKEVGMTTILVGPFEGGSPSRYVDHYLPSIYGLVPLMRTILGG